MNAQLLPKTLNKPEPDLHSTLSVVIMTIERLRFKSGMTYAMLGKLVCEAFGDFWPTSEVVNDHMISPLMGIITKTHHHILGLSKTLKPTTVKEMKP